MGMDFNLNFSRSASGLEVRSLRSLEDRPAFGLTRGPAFALEAKTSLALTSIESLLKPRPRRGGPILESRRGARRSLSHAFAATVLFLFIAQRITG